MLKWLWISGLVVMLDQASKQLVDNTMKLYESIAVIPMFNIRLAYNEGAAFSFLSDEGGWQRWFFTTMSIVISIAIIAWLKRLPKSNKLEAVSLSLILGGAIGNLIDRAIYGHVIDFLDVYYQTYHWPTFNIADSAISCGIILFIASSFLTEKQQQQANAHE